MEFELKFVALFPVNGNNDPMLEAGFKPLENETTAFEAFEAQVQARTSAGGPDFDSRVLVMQGLEVLTSSSRDLKVFAQITDAALSPTFGLQAPEFSALVGATHRALSAYWMRSHPDIREARNVRGRLLLVQGLLKSFEKYIDIGMLDGDADTAKAVASTLGQVAEIFAGYDNPWADIAPQFAALSNRLKKSDTQKVEMKAPSPSVISKSSSRPPKPRELRAKLVNLLSDMNRGEEVMEPPLSFHLRRRAAFLPFEGEVNAEARQTEFTDIPEARVQDVRAAVQAPTIEALQALEQTLVARPLWLTGHRLACEMAQKLGAHAQASAIHGATAYEISFFDNRILTFTFAKGLSFADRETVDWLSAPLITSDKLALSDEGEPAEDALSQLNRTVHEMSQENQNERQDLINQVEIAQAFSALSHHQLAASLARSAQSSLEMRDLLKWETDVVQKLKLYI